jgi:hypothetical protein
VNFSTPSKKRWMISPSPDFGSASDQTRKPSSLRSAQEITTTRCRCNGQEIAAILGPLALEGKLGHLGITKLGRQFMQRA